jgi:uncharacterized protein with HEPN domain
MSWREYLLHISRETEFILRNTAGIDFEHFLRDEVLQRAFLRSLEVIGEATKKSPTDFRERYPEVPWRAMAATRDKFIHNYFGVDYVLVRGILCRMRCRN